jgi:hypothetical protein
LLATERDRGMPLPLTVVCSAMIFQRAPGIFVGGADFLGLVQGFQKFRPILHPPERGGGFDKLIQCRGVRLPQPILLLARAWHVSIMLQRDVGLVGGWSILGRLCSLRGTAKNFLQKCLADHSQRNVHICNSWAPLAAM